MGVGISTGGRGSELVSPDTGIDQVAQQPPLDPHEAPGVHCLRGGVLPWCRTRDDGTDRGAP